MIIKLLGAIVFSLSLYVLYFCEQTAVNEHFRLIYWPAIFLTLVGPIGILMLSADVDQIKTLFGIFRHNSLSKIRKNLDQEYGYLRKLGNEYYAQGAKAFQQIETSISSPIHKTLERLAIRIPILDAYELLERDRDQLLARYEQCISLMTLGVRLAPSVGMLGTIIGMSQLLSQLKEPENIGTSMSVALLTTFYGLFFSLSIWTPLQNHLNRLLELKLKSFDQALHWLEILQKRKPAEYLENEWTGSGQIRNEGKGQSRILGEAQP